MKTILIDLVKKYPLPLHKYMEDIPKELQEHALELWKQNHRKVCECK